MKKYRNYQINPLTKQNNSGIPAGVAPNANSLTNEGMRDIARELDNPETGLIFATMIDDHKH